MISPDPINSSRAGDPKPASQNFTTDSEGDFFRFCALQRWSAEKIATEPGIRTPDFIVTTESGYRFIAEVTALKPDKQFLENEDGASTVKIGHALYNSLKNKAKRKQYEVRGESLPVLIVVAADLSKLNHLGSVCFSAALYGKIKVPVMVPSNPRQRPEIGNSAWNYENRLLREGHNTSISAVASLTRAPQELSIYHNKFARLPLDGHRLMFNTERVFQFVKNSGQAGWDEYGGDSFP